MLAAAGLAAFGAGARAPAGRPNEAPRQQPSEPAVLLPLVQAGALAGELPRPTPVASATDAPSSPTPTEAASQEPTPTDAVTPTEEPVEGTATPTEPPTATPSATPALDCRDVLQNGGFEQGPVSWTVAVNGQRQPPASAIQQRSSAAVAPRTGDWVAWLGGLTQGLSVLESAGLLTYTPREVVSATLRYHVSLLTEETANRRPNDWVRARLVGERRTLLVDGSSLSEEDFRSQRTWQPVTLDVAQYLATDQVRRLSLEVENDQQFRSWFYFDDIAAIACRARASTFGR